MSEDIGGGNLPDLDIPAETTETETLPRKRIVFVDSITTQEN